MYSSNAYDSHIRSSVPSSLGFVDALEDDPVEGEEELRREILLLLDDILEEGYCLRATYSSSSCG